MFIEPSLKECFPEQYGQSFAAVEIDEHIETLDLGSERFKNWVYSKCYKERSRWTPKPESFNSALNSLKGRAQFEGIHKELHLRIANDNVDYLYDLTNPNWEIVRVTDENWKVERHGSPIIFRRFSNQRPQVYPSKDYPADVLDKFINLLNIKDEQSRLLLKCYIKYSSFLEYQSQYWCYMVNKVAQNLPIMN